MTAEEIATKHGLYHSYTKLADDKVVAAIESHTAAHTAALRERLKQLEAKIASYESAIDGLKKVIDSLYNLKS